MFLTWILNFPQWACDPPLNSETLRGEWTQYCACQPKRDGNPCFHFLLWINLLKVNNLVFSRCQTLSCLGRIESSKHLRWQRSPLYVMQTLKIYSYKYSRSSGCSAVYNETLKFVLRGQGQLSWALTLRGRQCWQWQRLIKGSGSRTHIEGNVIGI